MASRGITSVPIFYVTEAGVAYQLADETEKVDHDVEESRIRLANILRNRRQQQQQQQQEQQQKFQKEQHQQRDVVEADGDVAMGNNDGENDDWEDVDSDDENMVVTTASDPVISNNTNTSTNVDRSTELAIRRIQGQQHRNLATSLVDREQQLKFNKLLARGARMSRKTANSSKAIASQFHYKEKPADNAAARAVVHHTGSHYVMAGGVQFQRGVRVKGVVSRHSKQGAKIQAARMAERNMYAAREDARGERAEGVRSRGKTKKSKKIKKKLQQQAKNNQDL